MVAAPFTETPCRAGYVIDEGTVSMDKAERYNGLRTNHLPSSLSTSTQVNPSDRLDYHITRLHTYFRTFSVPKMVV